MIRRALLAVFLIIFLIPLAPFAHAQTGNITSDISVSVSPENPGPLQQVTVTLNSYSLNLSAAEIQWSSDGKTVGGVGYTSYTLTTKTIGVSTNISATISAIGAAPITKTINITPMSVDLLWEATDSVVPPFYRGKALPTSESTVQFVAIPQIISSNGSLLSPNNFLYGWSDNYTLNQPKSGYAKDSFTIPMDYLNPIKHVGVDVSTRSGGTASTAEMDLAPVSPKLLWYVSSPLYGPQFNHTIDTSLAVSGSDTGIIAEPYFFSPGNPASPVLQYEWNLNGQKLSVPQIPNTLFLHRQSTDTGAASLDLTVTNLSLLFQEASAHLELSLQ